MSSYNNSVRIFGLDGYKVVPVGRYHFNPNTTSHYFPYGYETYPGTYILDQNLSRTPRLVESDWTNRVVFTPELCQDHPELLDTAKKVYVHSSCKMSRSMLAEKYKKCLNPYLADVVVIPNPDFSEFRLLCSALFINESAKMAVMVQLDEHSIESLEVLKNAKVGTRFEDLIRGDTSCGTHIYKTQDLLNSELAFIGNVIGIPNTQSYALEILTNTLPADKIVYEQSIQKTLGNESNKLTFESLVSIKDMLDSSDEDNVSAGLKALSMMDWMHYPNSIKFIMRQAERYKWVYNKAMGSTSVKFMLKSIAPRVRSRSRYPGDYDEEIYEQDYELFKQLKMHYDKVDASCIMDYMRYMEFMTVVDNTIVPKLRHQ